MNSKLKILLLLVALLSAASVSASKRGGLHFSLEYKYSRGFLEKISAFGGHKFQPKEHALKGHGIHLVALYDINPRMSAGAGIGVEVNIDPDHTSFPLYATFNYHPATKAPDFYVFTDLGHGIGRSNSSLHNGWLWNAGCGYRLMFRKHFGLNFRIGYNLKQFKNIKTYLYEGGFDEENSIYYLKRTSTTSKTLRHSLQVGFGFVF